ncbi:hypothetical protein [Marinobacterium marinum]|uniref:Uncharacterized protein n=1 Tax=Marinobacterium marinum TaxID=2756129 RepID=A0A7W1X0T8_9GAMM|nr:hypothetical protein [Marinobacterium marinum]MBA4503704.1 hypothetical protein [Marinobacterium marinum]
MAHIARYIIESSSQSVRSADAQVARTDEQACLHCNYSNNYYGDQVCVPRAR